MLDSTIQDDELNDEPIQNLEEEEALPFKYSITSYGADYDVDGLVKRLNKGDIFIPKFQRKFVWKLSQSSRFVESLLLGLPVPGIFLSKEDESQKLLVIDGQQRLKSLQNFYNGEYGLTPDVQKEYSGKTYSTLSDEDRRKLDNAILHATIMKQDKPTDDNSSVYFMFERLNTGGAPLRPQEIRAAIYHGKFNEVLEELNYNEAWRTLFGKVNSRMRDNELIVRFLALYFSGDKYSKPMQDFLNNFMGSNKRLQKISEEQIRKAFVPTVEIILKCLGDKAFKPQSQVNAALLDGLMVGVARRLEKGEIKNCELMRAQYDNLLANPMFLEDINAQTSNDDRVSRRINLATEAFVNI